MEGDVVWSLKWSSNISKNYYQSIKRMFGQLVVGKEVVVTFTIIFRV